ncbi:putative G:T/U mismatch-specific DNA glycosylase [Thiomonas sp. X19]|uniref:DNA-deoxyinosine glycosylase n=1 Tax=Thiomonas sp. X19 TaxID=1050370 RepID=UPI000B6B9277|nr:putative G:T/U mismatch-specific DNA glycosylase [Thiomonas sp. X19]
MPPPSPTRLQGLPPAAGAQTRLLLLGSFPSRASLQAQQYYAHPRNQFWPLLAALFELDLMRLDYAARLQAVMARGLGIWDVYAACEREGSLDAAITQAQPNDLPGLVARLPRLQAIAHNGGESARMMRSTASLAPFCHRLPSTSPANASWSFARKLEAWRLVFARHGLIAGEGSEGVDENNISRVMTRIESCVGEVSNGQEGAD